MIELLLVFPLMLFGGFVAWEMLALFGLVPEFFSYYGYAKTNEGVGK